MSNKIFPTNLSSSNEIVNVWLEVYEERGEEGAIIALIQLFLDRLKLSLVNNTHENDFEIPEHINLRTFNMDNFILALTANQDIRFDLTKQKADDQQLAELIVKLIKKTEQFRWLKCVQQFICALLRSKKTACFVAKTVVYLYTESVMLRNDVNLHRDVGNHMQQMYQNLSLTIAGCELSFLVLGIICDTFFDKISRRPQIIQNDAEGCEQIIVKFLSSEFTDINIKAMKHIIHCCEAGVHGRGILRLCSNESIVRELSTIIENIKGIKIQSMALDLACRIENVVRERTVFPEGVYQDCVCSDNKKIQQLVAKLCRIALRDVGSITPNPADVVIRATLYHQRFRQNYTTCPMRVTKTFFEEFTNWNAVFEAVQMRLSNVEFIDEIFALLRRVIVHIKNSEDHGTIESSLRSFSHKAIQFAQDLDRQHVTVLANIIFSLQYANKRLELIDNQHRQILKDILPEIITDYFSDFTLQMNAILMVKELLPIEMWQPNFSQCVDEFSAFRYRVNIDFDNHPHIMATFMQLGVFAWCHMFLDKDKSILLCNRSNEIVMSGQFDLKQNRTFLAYNLIVLVESCMQDANQGTQAVSRTRITNRLLEILEATQDDIDFLCVSVFWCLSNMERKFKSVSMKCDLKVLVTYLLKKIDLVTIDELGVNHFQFQHLLLMLDEIKMLLGAGCVIDIRDIVVHLNKRFPDYDHVLKLLNFCIKIQKKDMFFSCAFGVLNGLPTKKSQEEFMKNITVIIKQLPNQNDIWARITKALINSSRKRSQESLDERTAKKAKQTEHVIHSSIMKNWAMDDTQTGNVKHSTPLSSK